MQLGDLVQLKSGSPAMTIIYISHGQSSSITCAWYVYETNEFKRWEFPAEALKPSR